MLVVLNRLLLFCAAVLVSQAFLYGFFGDFIGYSEDSAEEGARRGRLFVSAFQNGSVFVYGNSSMFWYQSEGNYTGSVPDFLERLSPQSTFSTCMTAGGAADFFYLHLTSQLQQGNRPSCIIASLSHCTFGRFYLDSPGGRRSPGYEDLVWMADVRRAWTRPKSVFAKSEGQREYVSRKRDEVAALHPDKAGDDYALLAYLVHVAEPDYANRRVFRYWQKIIDLAAEFQVPIVVYLAPIDQEALVNTWGEETAGAIDARERMLTRFFSERGVACLDFSDLLTTDYFSANDPWACHVSPEGHETVAKHLYASVSDLYPEVFPPEK